MTKFESDDNQVQSDSGYSAGISSAGSQLLQKNETSKSGNSAVSYKVQAALTSIKLKNFSKIKHPGPQGFQAGQLRKKGLLSCLRNCGAFFASAADEENHYRRGAEVCTKYVILENAKAPVDLSKIPSGIRNLDRSMKVAENLIEELKRGNRMKSSEADRST